MSRSSFIHKLFSIHSLYRMYLAQAVGRRHLAHKNSSNCIHVLLFLLVSLCMRCVLSQTPFYESPNALMNTENPAVTAVLDEPQQLHP